MQSSATLDSCFVTDGVVEIDPLRDERWPRLLARHKFATVFHTREWLDALCRTYGYRVGVVTTSAGEELTNGLVFCRINSFITGSRIVSLPFSDHCTPLVQTSEQLNLLLSSLTREIRGRGRVRLEIRPCVGELAVGADLVQAASYCHHVLDLRPSFSTVYRNFHPDSVRRKIKRAERSGLIYDEGQSAQLIEKFYALTVMTRRRQGLPPQPIRWYQNLVAALGGKLKIRLVSQGSTPAAGILTIRDRNTMIYKYGCSNAAFHRLGPVQLAMWMAIQDAKNEGLESFDFGRTDWDNKGLIQFKDRWGAQRSTLQYWRYPNTTEIGRLPRASVERAKRILRRAPASVLPILGNLLYRHIG